MHATASCKPPGPALNAHDRFVASYSRATALDALADLSRRTRLTRRDPEHRWILERRAALQRHLRHL